MTPIDSEDSPDSKMFVTQLVANTRRIYVFIATLIPLAGEVDDVYQQTCLALWQKRHLYDPERPFYPWACGFAHNEALRHLRSSRTARLRLSEKRSMQLQPNRFGARLPTVITGSRPSRTASKSSTSDSGCCFSGATPETSRSDRSPQRSGSRRPPSPCGCSGSVMPSCVASIRHSRKLRPFRDSTVQHRQRGRRPVLARVGTFSTDGRDVRRRRDRHRSGSARASSRRSEASSQLRRCNAVACRTAVAVAAGGTSTVV